MFHRMVRAMLQLGVLVPILVGCIGSSAANGAETTKSPTTYGASRIAPSITPVASLTPEDAYRLLIEFLRTNGGCKLPCWWGITPGISTSGDAQSKWTPLLGAADYSDLSEVGVGRMGFSHSADDVVLFIDLKYSVPSAKDGIEMIHVNMRSLRQIEGGYEPVYDAAAFKEVLAAYTLPGVLAIYGAPSRIVLSMEIISAEPTSPDFFYVWLLYPELGSILRFTAEADVRGDIVRGCPSKSFIDMWLLPRGNSRMYQKQLAELTDDWDGLSPVSSFFKSIEDATTTTADSFYQTYKTPTESCLETPLAIWPSH